jgi:hypothetical protein
MTQILNLVAAKNILARLGIQQVSLEDLEDSP